MKPIIWPYKMGSNSAKILAHGLGTIRVYSDGKYRPRANHLIVNWGNSHPPTSWVPGGYFMNTPDAVQLAANKMLAFDILQNHNVPIPVWRGTRASAEALFAEGFKKVYCRTILNGHSGEGIVIATSPEELVDAPLYTAGIGWRQEFRVHVFDGGVIDFIKKCKMSAETLEERGIVPNTDIRSHANGWVYAREGIELPAGMGELAVLAVQSLDLDFGAVDCCIDKSGKLYVLEVNTAPGLDDSGTTLQRYIDAILRKANV